MTDLQKGKIRSLRSQGYGYATIAKSVGLKKDAVVAFCRKAGLTGTEAADNSRISLDTDFCPQCGVPLKQTPAESASDSARTADVSLGGTLTWKRSTAELSTASPAPTAESLSLPTATPGENTAPTPATLQTVSKAAMAMCETMFDAELQYQTAIV